MPVEYSEDIYDYRTQSIPLSEWLREKDDDNWEFVTICPCDYSGLSWKHIIKCIFRRKT